MTYLPESGAAQQEALKQREQQGVDNLRQMVKDMISSGNTDEMNMAFLQGANDANFIDNEIQTDQMGATQALNSPDPNIDASDTLRAQAMKMDILLEEVIPLLKGDLGKTKELFNVEVTDAGSKYVLQNLLSELNLSSLTLDVMPYVFLVFFKALNGKVEKNAFNTLTTAQYRMLYQKNSQLCTKILDVLEKASVEANGQDKKEMQKRREAIMRAVAGDQDAMLDPYERMMRGRYNQGETLSQDEIKKLSKNLDDLMNSIRANPEYAKDLDSVLTYLTSGMNAVEIDDPKKAERVRQILADRTLNLPNIGEIQQLLQKDGNFQDLLTWQAQQYGVMDEAREMVSILRPSLVFNRLINAESLTWNQDGSDSFRREVLQMVNEIYKGATSDSFSNFQQSIGQGEQMLFASLRRYLLKYQTSEDILKYVRDAVEKKLGTTNSPEARQKINRLKQYIYSFFGELSSRLNLIQFLTQQAHDTNQISDIPSDQRSQLFDKLREPEIRKLLDGEHLIRSAEGSFPQYHAWRAAENSGIIPEGYYTQQESVEDGTTIRKIVNPDRERYRRNFEKIVKTIQSYAKRHEAEIFANVTDPNERRELRKKLFLDRTIRDSEITQAIPIAEWIARLITEETPMALALTLVPGSPKRPMDGRKDTNSFFHSYFFQADRARHDINENWGLGDRGTPWMVQSPINTMKAVYITTDTQHGHDSRPPIFLPPPEEDVKHKFKTQTARVLEGVPDSPEEFAKLMRDRFFDTHISGARVYNSFFFQRNWKFEGGYGVNPNLADLYHRETGKSLGGEIHGPNREQVLAWVDKQAGYGSRFYYAEGMADADLDAYIAQVYNINTTTDSGAFGAKKGELTGKNRFKRELKVVVDGKERAVSVVEFDKMRKRSERGRVMFEAVKKQPVAFLNMMSQLIPEIADGKIQITLKDGSAPWVSAADFYLSGKYGPGGVELSDKYEVQRRKVHNYAIQYFGEQNVGEVQTIMGFFEDAQQSFMPAGAQPTDENYGGVLVKAKEEAFDAMFSYYEGASAIARVMGTDIQPDYIISDDEYNSPPEGETDQEKARSKKEREDRMKVRKLLFEGKNALIPHFMQWEKSQSPSGSAFGDRTVGAAQGRSLDMGNDSGFFQRAAKAWYEIENNQIDPIFYRDTYGVLTDRPKSGDATKRREGDVGATREAKGKIEDFENAIASWLVGGEEDDRSDRAKIFSVRQEIYGSLSKVDAGKAKNLVKQLSAMYYATGLGTATGRITPFDFIQTFALGEKGSWGKMHYGMANLRQLSREKINTDIDELLRQDMITREQADELREQFLTEKARLYTTDVAPTILILVLAYVMYQYFQKAIKENEGGG